MVQELLPLLPHEIGRTALVAALIGTLVGAGLWLAGARFSRPMITLLGVALGAMIGRHLPAWMNWNANSMATSVGGAVVLGMSGFVLHRAWVGLGLGLVLAAWAALATWVFAGGAEATFAWPAVDQATTLQTFGQSLWANVPDKVKQVAPYACGGAMVSGFLGTLIWPRLGVVLLYSALGTSLLVGMGLIAIENGRPQWITIVPAQTWAQITTLLGLVAFGAVVQWQLAPTTKSGGGGSGDEPAAPKRPEEERPFV
jgi:hypothetical protein